MNTNGNGFRLTNACIIGQQGNPASTNDNQWLGTWSLTNPQTYLDNSIATNSPLYIRTNGGSTYQPIFNSGIPTNTGGYYGVGNGLTGVVATTSPVSCGTLPQPPCTGPNCPIFNGRTLAQKAVQDSIEYPILYLENTYRAQLKYFKLIAMNDSLADSSVVLQNFYAANQNSNLAKITAIESNLAQGNVAAAQSINTAFAPANTIEGNYQKFYTANINITNNAYSVLDSSNLYTLATACPATNGDVVYSARALYNAMYNQYQYFNDNCNYDSLAFAPSARLRKAGYGYTKTEIAAKSLLVYPNPSTGDIFISMGFATDKQMQVEIMDITGRTILQDTYTVNNGVAQVNTQLTNGIYFVKVTTSNGTVKQQKVIISK